MKITEGNLRRLVRQMVERAYPTEEEGWITGVDNRGHRGSDLPTDPDWRAGYRDGGSDKPPADEENDMYMNGYAAGKRGMYR